MMKENNNDIVGTQVGIYNVLGECDFRAKDGHKMYHVQCIYCGFETNMIKSSIGGAKKCTHLDVNGHYKACYKTHYTWDNPRIARIFRGMKNRCYNKSEECYMWYGGKGICICDEWLNNPKSFEEWALKNGYNDNLIIDRIEEEKDYCPENCQWVDLGNNARYKSTTSYIYVNGEVHTGREWAKY